MHRLINTSACQRAETEVKSQCRFMSFQTGKNNINQLLNSPCDLQPPEVSRRPLTFSLGPAATPLRVDVQLLLLEGWDMVGQSQVDTDAWLLFSNEAADMAFWAKRSSVCFLSY